MSFAKQILLWTEESGETAPSEFAFTGVQQIEMDAIEMS
jgi:hypothetical protein